MSQRISLTRIIALNWYGFRQIFDVQDNVLISGAFGTGKSALLDLIQYVLLGEHWRANRAAAGNKQGRDLVGYCLGDTNQIRNGQRHFLRQNGVTLVALEFTRKSENKNNPPQRETWGIRLGFTSPDAAPKPTYFCIPERLDYAMIAPDGQLLSEEDFRTWLRREHGNESLFGRQKDYLEEMAAPRHLNFDAHAFHRTFPKAIAFEIEENVEKFIREFILEESPLDVREVRSALQAYDDTRKRLEKQENEALFLRRISDHHKTFHRARRDESILNYLHDHLKCLQLEERRDLHAAHLKRLETEREQELMALSLKAKESEETRQLLAGVRFEIQSDIDGAKLSELDRSKRNIEDKVTQLLEVRKSTQQQIEDRHYRWMQWLKHGRSIRLEGLAEGLIVNDQLLAQLRTGKEVERLSALPLLASRFHEIWTEVERLSLPLRDQIVSYEKRLIQLADDLENLSKGQAPGTFPLLTALQKKLGNRVQQLGRLIEVKPEAERWWPALELYLGRNRWALVVEKESDYRIALELLRKTAPGREMESLLNPSEIEKLSPMKANHSPSLPPAKNSLLDKVEILHPQAQRYVESLLGKIQCVETIEELESVEHDLAITPEGIFKQTPLRHRLKPGSSVELTLGREGLQRMRAIKQKEQIELRAEKGAVEQQKSDVETWISQGRQGGLGDGSVPDRSMELAQLPEMEAELSRIRETLAILMTPERESRQTRLHELEEKERHLNEEIGILRNNRIHFETSARPIRDNLATAIAELQQATIERLSSLTKLKSSFPGILETELQERENEVRKKFQKWTEIFSAITQSRQEASIQAVEFREKRKQERMALLNSRSSQGYLLHPEYQDSFSPEDESNEMWDSRLQTLDTVELEKSRLLAADRKREWERRLEENVLNELNRRISEAQNTIKLLDRYLSRPVGRFRYRISQRKDTAGYAALWTLLNSGLEATDPLMSGIQDDEVRQAKESLMQAVYASDQNDDRARRLLDYRNYHCYDLEMVPADKPDAPPISLSRSGRNLSGGESQAPFFISMLAAFRRVYDRGDRSSSRSQQLGIVVMDEAFSKLSGDGIEDCLALAHLFQLQLVMAFPPERLGVMVPHAQTVVICQKEIQRDTEGYVTQITNLPLIVTMSEAMEALT